MLHTEYGGSNDGSFPARVDERVLRDWGKANSDGLVKYLQALIEGLRWAMKPENKSEVVGMLSDRLRLPSEVAAASFAIAAHPEKGFARDAKFDMPAFATS